MFTLKTVSFSAAVFATCVALPLWAQPQALSDADMAQARGKFSAGAVVGMDLVMRADWQDQTEGQMRGELRVHVNPGASKPIVVQSSSQSIAGNGAAPAGAQGAQGVIEGGPPVVQGIAQGNQIAGFDNKVSNQFEVTVIDPALRLAPSIDPLNTQGNSNSQAHSSAGDVQAGVDDKGLSIRIRPTGGGGTTQRVGTLGGGVGGVQQWAQVPGNNNQVRLSTAMELHMRPLSGGEAASQSARQAMQLMPGRLR
jgi:hypothetical protein